MNPFAHFFSNYFVLSFFIPAEQHIVAIAILSIVLDADHIPGIMMLMLNPRKTDYVHMLRSFLQEPFGIMMIIAILYLAGLSGEYLLITAVCLVMHWIIDFLTVDTKPFAPFSGKVVNVFFHNEKQRLEAQFFITAISIVLFVAVF